MKSPAKSFILIAAPVFAVLAAGVLWYISEAVPIGTGYAAKYLCSHVFVSGRDAGDVFETDIKPVNVLAKLIDYEIDREKNMVTATAFHVYKSRAVYRECCGCTLAVDVKPEELREQAPEAGPVKIEVPKDRLWPHGERGPVDPASLGVDAVLLEKALDYAFDEPGPGSPRHTRAVAVAYDGKLITERYRKGYTEKTPILGWSMTKSVTNALVGIMVRKGELDIYAPAPVPEWKGTGDPRAGITLDNLLRMSSGLRFTERYEPLFDATDLLYSSFDTGGFAASKKLDARPGGKWSYSTGTTNIISRIVKEKAGGSLEDYYLFAERELFAKLKMKSAVLEPDPSGTFVGSSYMFATPRDWARFGLLYLNDGKFEGERILPEGWVEYSATPAKRAPQGRYGAHFWLNAGEPGNPENRRWKSLPPDAFFATGFQHQYVGIIPSKKLVAVRMGLTIDPDAWDIEKFVSMIIEALPDD